MQIREAAYQDLSGLLKLYTHLHSEAMPAVNSVIEALWRKIIDDINHHLVLGIVGGEIISACVLLVVPNLTHAQRPYALIENVVTHRSYRGKGYATQILEHARQLAIENGCYKIMLMTGSKEEATMDFYRRAGYNTEDKTAFVQWLDR